MTTQKANAVQMIDQAIAAHMEEIQKLRQARAILVPTPGRKPSNVVPIRTLSVAAKKRIAEAARRRWKAAKAAGRNSLATAKKGA